MNCSTNTFLTPISPALEMGFSTNAFLRHSYQSGPGDEALDNRAPLIPTSPDLETSFLTKKSLIPTNLGQVMNF